MVKLLPLKRGTFNKLINPNMDNIFTKFITIISPHLIQLGFEKKNNNFYLTLNKNYGIINFQKSRDLKNGKKSFTINFGIYSNTIGQYEYNYDEFVKPKHEQCHWHSRIGDFMPNYPDYWWEITPENLDKVSIHVLKTIRDIAIPNIHKRLSDEGLVDCWINETYVGTTEFGQFKYLTILLKAKNDLITLNNVVKTFLKKFKGKPNFNLALYHLEEIGYSLPNH